MRPHHTVMLGNSLTERGAWAEYFPEAHVINRGIGGDCVAGMAARLDSIVAGRPRAIFLMAGVNDLIFSTIAPEALLRQYERLLDRIAAESPATQVFIQSPLPLDEARNEPYFTGKNARIEAFDRLLRRMAARRGLKFIDIRSRMLRDGKLPAEYTVDGIHLTPAGYAVWVEALRPYVTPAGARIGTVTCAGRGLAGVVVSDGDNCAATGGPLRASGERPGALRLRLDPRGLCVALGGGGRAPLPSGEVRRQFPRLPSPAQTIRRNPPRLRRRRRSAALRPQGVPPAGACGGGHPPNRCRRRALRTPDARHLRGRHHLGRPHVLHLLQRGYVGDGNRVPQRDGQPRHEALGPLARNVGRGVRSNVRPRVLLLQRG